MEGGRVTGEELRSFTVGAVAIGVFCLVLMLSYFTTHIHGATADSNRVYAAFNRVDGLAVGDEVQLAGVPVGRVAAMTLQPNFQARLTLLVADDVPLPTDTSAAIHTDGLFGRKFVVLEPGGDETLLGDGGVITFTQDSLIVSELLDLIIAEGRAQRRAGEGIGEVEPR
ncbi:MAG: MCE family protein [Rhodospirillales bacterium]|nr:MCE family protein [Rhodospirillales bacterium]